MYRYNEVTAGAVVLVASPHTFDPSLGDLFASWAVGACIALAPRTALFTSLGACLASAAATHVLTTPAMLGTIPLPPPPLPALRVIALGGEPMPMALAAAWLPRVEVLANTYGVTECCVYQAFHRVGGGKKGGGGGGGGGGEGDNTGVSAAEAAGVAAGAAAAALEARRGLGQPLRGCRLLLVKEPGDDPSDLLPEYRTHGGATSRDQSNLPPPPPPPGTVELAELWIAGPQVGRGYANMPELTAERFKPAPRPPTPPAAAHTGGGGGGGGDLGGEELCFRTGDVVRRTWGADGRCAVEVVGRRDAQVKINGQRVELGEVEAALCGGAVRVQCSC